MEPRYKEIMERRARRLDQPAPSTPRSDIFSDDFKELNLDDWEGAADDFIFDENTIGTVVQPAR